MTPLRRLLLAVRRPSLPLLLAAATMLGYMAFNVGEMTPDPETRYLVAESIVRDGDLAIDENPLTVPSDGAHYSVFFPGQTVIFLPAAAVAEAARLIVGGDPVTFTRLGNFIACMLVVPFMAALAVLGHVALLRTLGLGVRAASAAGLLLAYGTLQFVWATAGSEEVSLGAATAWAYVLGLRAIRRLPELEAAPAADAGAVRGAIVRGLGVGGVLVSTGLMHRGTAVAAALGFVVLTLPALIRHRRHLLRITLGLVPWFLLACLLVAIVPLYHWARFGDPLDSGYGQYYAVVGGLWETPLLEGLAGHLVSPGKSLFLNTPWLLLLVPAVASARVRRVLGPLGPAIAVATVVHLLLYSKTTFWAGAFGFGIRYHVCMMPLWLAPIAIWWWGPARETAAGVAARAGGLLRAAVIGLATVSVALQFFGVALNSGYEHLVDRPAYDADGRRPVEAAWDPTRSPILIRVTSVVRLAAGGDLMPPGESEDKRLQVEWNVFPVRAAIMLGDGLQTRTLFALWAVLLIGFAAVLLAIGLRLRPAAARAGPVAGDPEPPAAGDGYPRASHG